MTVENGHALARQAADAIFEKKGADIVLLDVGPLFVLTDVFVIATGTSRTHVQALAEFVQEKLVQGAGIKPIRVEGKAEAEWVLVDFGDVIVHLFQAGPRDFYGLERLWADCERVEWAEPAIADG